MTADESNPSDPQPIGPVFSDPTRPVRVTVALGDTERERQLLPALAYRGEVAIAERCLSADELLESLEKHVPDVVLISTQLHRLDASSLARLSATRVPLLFLETAPGQPDRGLPATAILPAGTPPEVIVQQLLATASGARPPSEALSRPAMAPASAEEGLPAIVVAGGHGSPGRTTVAINLAAALGRLAPAVLVDADFTAPSVAAHLDADPTRNLLMLAYSEPATKGEWEQAIARETQPLGAGSPRGAVLCGLPKLEMSAILSSAFVARLLAELRRRYRYVVVDTGPDLDGRESVLHAAVLRRAGHILFVATADLVGLWRGRAALGQLHTQAPAALARTALIINRHHSRFHHSGAEIAWALGLPVAMVVPDDPEGARRALALQRPLAFERRSRAGRAYHELEHRLDRGAILPPAGETRSAAPSRARELLQSLAGRGPSVALHLRRRQIGR
jgi:Mrp family chromosome partitioning ATPase